MNAELEAILKAFDAFMQARGETAESLRMIYESRLEDILQKHPGISKERLEQAIRKKYLQWLRAESSPSSVPPKA
jgi:hypothetical protein